jgi:hypothetical protein
MADRLHEVQLKAEKAEAERKRREAEAENEPWWKTEGIPQLRGRIRRAAQRGCRFLMERLSHRHAPCPDFVLDYFKELGFVVDLRDPGSVCEVLTIRWMADEESV